MKKVIIIGVIFAGVAVCVLLAHQGVVVSNPNPNEVEIKIHIANGKIVSVDPPGETVGASEINTIHQNQGFKYVTEVLHATTNPTCLYINMGGWYVKICR